MKSRRNLLTIGLLCAIVLCTNADNSVNILSKYGQLVTSSTLNWIQHIHYANYKHFVIGGFEYDGQAKESKESKDSWESEGKSSRVILCIQTNVNLPINNSCSVLIFNFVGFSIFIQQGQELYQLNKCTVNILVVFY